MGLVAKDDLRIAAGLLPITSLCFFAGGEGVFVIVPFVLEKDLVGTGTGFFSRERVMEVFLLRDGDVIDSLRSGFLECAGDAIDPVANSTMCHSNKDNN